MSTEHYVDIFAAKSRVESLLRDSGSLPYSRILMNSQLPEDVLAKVLQLLVKERKVKERQAVATKPVTTSLPEPVYQPVSGGWGLTGSLQH